MIDIGFAADVRAALTAPTAAPADPLSVRAGIGPLLRARRVAAPRGAT